MLGVAVLVVVAIGLSAASLTSTVDRMGGTQGEGNGTVNATGPTPPQVEEPATPALRPDTPGLSERLGLAVTALVTLGLFVYVFRYGRTREVTVVGTLLLFVLALYVARVVLGDPDVVPNLESGPANATGGSGDPGGDSVLPGLSGGGFLRDLSRLWLLGLLAALGLAGVVVVRRLDEQGEPEPAEREGSGRVTVPRRTGRPVDRTADDHGTRGTDEDEDPDNEVYRAWAEMTAQLNIESGEATTPRELERRAVTAGMAPDDVRELTALFETVRYGGESATEDREQRAMAVLRRLGLTDTVNG